MKAFLPAPSPFSMNRGPTNVPYWNGRVVPSGLKVRPRSGSVAVVYIALPAALSDELITPAGEDVAVRTPDRIRLAGKPLLAADVLDTIELTFSHQERV